eukprot:COSAG02_NODE_4526_length_5258_cov_6.207405_3_plen_89_part_00
MLRGHLLNSLHSMGLQSGTLLLSSTGILVTFSCCSLVRDASWASKQIFSMCYRKTWAEAGVLPSTLAARVDLVGLRATDRVYRSAQVG